MIAISRITDQRTKEFAERKFAEGKTTRNYPMHQAIRYSQRLADNGVVASVGSKGEATTAMIPVCCSGWSNPSYERPWCPWVDLSASPVTPLALRPHPPGRNPVSRNRTTTTEKGSG